MNIKTITLFGIILNIICIIKGQHKIIFKYSNYNNTNCIHTSGQPGSCVLFPKCQRHLIGPNLHGNTCGFEGNSPKICCPDQNPKIGDMTKKVLSPKLDFECGEANLNQIEGTNDYDYRLNNNNYDNTNIESDDPDYITAVLRLVIGGIEATPNEWPWAVLVGVQIPLKDLPPWFCTGSLINRKFVLSAAHCLERFPDIIRLGEHSILDDTDVVHVDRIIIKTFEHPLYKSTPAKYHDLVLFEMDIEVIFRPNSINPICIPWSDAEQIIFLNKKMTVVGWGATENRGEHSDVILKADVESFDVNVCDENYKTLFTYDRDYPQGITEEFYICAGNQTASVDTCGGDSGGPIMYKEGNKYFIAGVTSTGYGCGSQKFPGLYINLSNTNYLQWIKDTAF